LVRLVAIAAWIGLAYGIFEGLESFLLSLLPQGLSWQNGNSVDALIFMPALYLVAYLAIGGMVGVVAVLIRRPWWDVVLVFGLVAMSGYLAARNQGAVFSIFASALLGLGIASIAFRLYRKHRDRWSTAIVRSLPLLALTAAGIIGGTHAAKRLVEARRLANLPAIERDRPNILLIVLDTQRADHLSSYGYHRPTTPHLDALADGGVLFERAFSASSWTLPAHASLFTGLMVHEHGAGLGGRRVLDSDYPTLAERLGREGYATGGFVANIFWTGRHTGLARGFLHYEDFYGTLGDALQRMTLVRDFQKLQEWTGGVDIRGRKHASHINDDFLGWVDRLDGRPFFAFLNYMDVHAPYLPPAPFEGMFGPVRPEFRPRKLEIGNEPLKTPSAQMLVHRIDRYDESLRYLDEHIGRLLAQLEQRGLLENTAIIVTSDHGEHFGEHGLHEHGKSLYTQETQVPLIIRRPGGTAGGRVKEPVSTINLAATVGALTGLPPATFPGRSLLPQRGGSTDGVPVFSEMGETGLRGAPAGQGWLRSLVDRQWHFILRQNGEMELYDLVQDPEETNNLAPSPDHAAVVRRLRDKLEKILASSGERTFKKAGR
jgi:arylsulfatase A-like enzyme